MKRILYILLALISVLPVAAQSNMIYSCDFEDETERAQWILNAAANPQQKANLTNFWNIGEAGHFAPNGENGLFIGTSESATESACSGAKTIENVAYRVLPEMEAGNYTITFNWIANGKGGQEGLYALLVPVSTNTYSGATALTMAWFKPCVIPMTLDTVMQGTSTWSVATAHFSLSQTAQLKLVFMFFATRGAAVDPAPAVDNIEIFTNVGCNAPTNVSHTITGMDVNLQWDGNADSYDIRTYSYETGAWQEQNVKSAIAPKQTALISNVEEGIGVFFLRSHCGDTHSEWVKYEKFIFHKGVRCIDYMDLTKNNCAYGLTANPAATKGVIDFGYADKYSRHTLHYVPNEIDPRTVGEDGSCLKTKPDDALASVRLGNWNIGGEAEQITYQYKVADDDNAILQLRYAVVMEDPNHDEAAQPRFTLQMTHKGSAHIGCGEANFVSGGTLSPAEGWHTIGEGTAKVMWKEWTTVSINLQDYIGETITIKLTTYDCTQQGHYGYAYFTLGCSGGEMSGLNCGEDNPTTKFTAPEGFKYRWYLNDPTQVLSTADTFIIDPMDTLTYHVDVINKTNEDCFYTLSACGWPRIPVPVADYSAVAERCKNVVMFNNKSHIKLKNQITGKYERSNEKITSLYWDFGDGTEVVQCLDSMVKHLYPDTGGVYTMRLSAGISNDACVETLELPIRLPNLQIPPTDESEHVCRKDYPFGYPYYTDYGEKIAVFFHDIDTILTLVSKVSGCDSLINYSLRWSDTIPFPADMTICEGDTILFKDTLLTTDGVYCRPFTDQYGCDSIVELTLRTTPLLAIRYRDSFYVCEDDRVLEIEYETISGEFNEMLIRFDAKAQSKGMDSLYIFHSDDEVQIHIPDSIAPTLLSAHVEFTPNNCSVSDKDILVELRYANSIFKVKKGMLGVMNERFNGGQYIWDSFQWYKNDTKINGATYSVFSVTDEDIDSRFSVELVRHNDADSAHVRACEIIYKAIPTYPATHTTAAPYEVYNTTGHKMGEWNTIHEISGLVPGIYIIKDQQGNAYKLFY